MPEEIEVPTEGLQEKLEEAAEELAHERAEEKQERRWVSRVAVSAALLAVAAAISALLAGHHSNEGILDKMEEVDAWGEFQANGIKQSILEGRDELLQAEGKSPPKVEGGVAAKLAKYKQQRSKSEEEARDKKGSSEDHMHRHIWFARAVTAFQISIAIAAIAVLAKRPKLWLGSVGLGLIGVILAILGFLPV
jgi:hypothetical protein